MTDLIVVNPEIPPNTGNLGRLTLGFGVKLVIVGEPSFDLSADAARKRAGLDYWEDVELIQFPDWQALRQEREGPFHLLTKFSDRQLTEAHIQPDHDLIVGCESTGVPETVHSDPGVNRWSLPMAGSIRSYNQANAAAMGLYEAFRQHGHDQLDNPYSGQSPTDYQT